MKGFLYFALIWKFALVETIALSMPAALESACIDSLKPLKSGVSVI